MTRNQYMAQVLTGVRSEIEKTITSLGLKPEEAHGLLCVSKTLENVATQLRGREIKLSPPPKDYKAMGFNGPSPLPVDAGYKPKSPKPMPGAKLAV